MTTSNKKSLSDRVLENTLDQPALGRANKNLALFRAIKDDIEHALDDGWSISSVWSTLRKEQSFLGSYSCFRLYVKKFITDKKQKELLVANEPLPVSKKELESQKQPESIPQKPKQWESTAFKRNKDPLDPEKVY